MNEDCKPTINCSDPTTVSLKNCSNVPVISNDIKNELKENKFKRHHKHRRRKSNFLCKSQSNSLVLILGVYIVVFSVASIILVTSVLRLQYLSETEQYKNKKTLINHGTSDLFDSKEMKSLFSKRLYKEFKWPFRISPFNCSNLSKVKKFNYLTSGWTKNVFSFEFMGQQYALKSVNNNGIGMKKCTEKETMETCIEKASLKMYKEYILSRELYHKNIIEVLAWCISNNNYSNDVAIITELCSPIDTISLLRMSFSQRLKIVLDLSQLLVYLANSPLGSVAINDFQRQQFVLCDNTLKLTDLDDLSIEEPRCNTSVQCSEKCIESCENYNGILNCIDAIVKAAVPHLKTILYYAKAELTPPKVKDIPEIKNGVARLLKAYKSGAWKQVPMREACLNALVTTEVVCWFFIGECIGKRHIVGYKLN
ncbi:hypothetical protein RUM43_009980 [Polyplax serrata]|uniref:Protein kinase domain-containing protein n=1 Tax=Polyplax serrata TaxID=468196 RepID=A0AAN8PJY6_POLSC